MYQMTALEDLQRMTSKLFNDRLNSCERNETHQHARKLLAACAKHTNTPLHTIHSTS